MAKKITYSDLDLNFGIHPVSKDVTIKTDEAAIKAAIKNLILTKNTERPFNSHFGINIKGLLFENISPLTIGAAKKLITQMITNYEPRVNVDDVKIVPDSDRNSITIYVIFTVIGKFNPISLEIALGRSR